MSQHSLIAHLVRSAVSVFAILAMSHGSLANELTRSTEFHVGTAIVDVSPTFFPVAVNGGMTSQSATQVHSPLHARALVISQADQQIAMVVVDSCMMGRELLDEIKSMAEAKTGIAANQIMISATHTHSAAASMSCLGTDADPEYQAYLRLKVTEAIETAQRNRVPAKVGWGTVNAAHFMALRRWVLRPDRMGLDPFGNPTVRANMHAGRNWDDVTGTSGPEDPDLNLIVFKNLANQTIAVLGNLSMHYFSGVPAIHADYFGLYCDGLQDRISEIERSPSSTTQPFPLAIMSHGCSGDIWRLDYSKETPLEFETITIEDYTTGLIDLTLQALGSIDYQQPTSIAAFEQRITLKYRTPDAQRLHWAREIVQRLNGQSPTTVEEVYAREQILLHDAQETEVVVQAIRLGDIAIATTPTETYALTGLKLKLQSPLARTMVIELANGGDGYIPPPEQHALGGYNTWPARSAGLEVQAEPKIVEAALTCLEKVACAPRKIYRAPNSSNTQAIIDAAPMAYWRLDDLNGPRARDASKHNRHGIFEPGVVFFLEGAPLQQRRPDSNASRSAPLSNDSASFSNRSTHFAGGRLLACVGALPEKYEVSLWIWNGMPANGRDIAGWFYSRGTNFSRPDFAEQIGVGGRTQFSYRLILQCGNAPVVGGTTEIPRWTWNHVRMVRDRNTIQVFLNEASTPEIATEVEGRVPEGVDELFFGGSSSGEFSWEGRLDEIVITDATTAADRRP